jgi:hypothetical protein
MSHPMVILVESAPVEAILARAALAQRPEVLVLQADDLRAAKKLLRDAPVALAIVGKTAMRDGKELRALASGVPVVGIGVEVPAPLRKRALAAGVREVHERPREWRAYLSLVSGLIDAALPTRTG